MLLRRTRPGGESYLTTPGGGPLAGETLPQAAARECAEELGARVTVGPLVLVVSILGPARGSQPFFLARLDGVDPDLRTGHEFAEPWRGTYETVHLEPDDAEALADLRPAELVDLLRQRGRELAAQAAVLP